MDEAKFATVRDMIAVSDSVISKHLKQLEEAGYVVLRKAAEAGRQRTWIAITPAGYKAFAAHVNALKQLVATELPPKG